MKTQRNARLQAESDILRELAQEKPATPKEVKALLEKRKREFDGAWKIDPTSATDYTPIKLVG